MQIYAYICAYSSCAKWRLCVTLLKRNFLKNPTGKLVEMELRDGGFHEVTALSPGSNEANRSEFPQMFLSGFLRFFFRNVSAFGSSLVPRVRFAFCFLN